MGPNGNHEIVSSEGGFLETRNSGLFLFKTRREVFLARWLGPTAAVCTVTGDGDWFLVWWSWSCVDAQCVPGPRSFPCVQGKRHEGPLSADVR